jgi:hypothetical protein
LTVLHHRQSTIREAPLKKCGKQASWPQIASINFGRTSKSAIYDIYSALIGKRRSTRERKYYLSNLPVDTPNKTLAGAIKARRICEQAQHQFKEEPRLDRFKGFTDWAALTRTQDHD